MLDPTAPDSTGIDDSEPVSRHFVSQGLRLHYLDWGNADAPTLILVHGNRDHARSWDWTARALRDRFHVVALDLRGHGDSAWSPDGCYLLAYHVIDLVELVEALGSPRVSIVAHSFGGGVASRYAAMFPDRIDRLAIVDGFGPSPDIYAKWAEAGPVDRTRDWIAERRDPKFARPRRLATVDDAAARMAAANARLSHGQAHHLARHGVRLHDDGYGWKYDPQVGMFAPEDFALDPTAFWRAIEAETLICYGTESWSSDPVADGRAAHFRHRHIVAIDQAGHWPHHDQLDIFVTALRNFF
jgi:pimeloyl-ACP methyl ester carboxylesterase